MTTPPTPRILALATQGSGGGEEARILTLLRDLQPDVFAFDRKHKLRSGWRLFRLIRRQRPDLVVLEGTGLAGGLPVLLGRWLAGVSYVLSSGDAVGPWVGIHYPLLGPLFGLYERWLCSWCAGFIGWTPYLVGRALTFGAPRAMTAAGWAPFTRTPEQHRQARIQVRARLGIPAEALVVGIVGSLVWNRRLAYAYGAELVRASALVRRPDLRVLIVGDGSGREPLERLAADRAGRGVLFTGRVPLAEVPDYLAALDIGSLPQSVDAAGSFRYTTKISEYLAAGLPIVTGQVPLAYDLDDGWLWRLPGRAPWSAEYLQALAALLERMTPEELALRRAAIPSDSAVFNRERQIARTREFLTDLLAAHPVRSTRA